MAPAGSARRVPRNGGVRHRRPGALAAAALGLAAAACSDPAPGAGTAVVVDTVAGVVVVTNPSTGPEWTVEPILVLGQAVPEDPAAPDAFGRIHSVVLDDRGGMFIADGQALVVTHFASDGAYVRSLGRPGGGPGEFRALNSLTWMADTLLVLDPGNARVHLYSRDGDVVGAWPWIPLTGPASQVRFFPVDRATAYVPNPILDPGRRGVSFVKVTGGGLADTLTIGTPEGPTIPAVVCFRPDGGLSSFSVPFARRFLVAPAPGDRAAVAWSSDYRIAIVDAGGDTLRVVRRDYHPVPVTDEDWDRETAPYRELRERTPQARCSPDVMDRPAYRPALQGLHFDRDGRLVAEVTARGGTRYDVYDRDGRLVGSIRAPERDPSVLPYFGSGRFVQVIRDDLDVQRVAVYPYLRPPDDLRAGSPPTPDSGLEPGSYE